MNIMVYDVQADGGGAATILEYYYNIHKQDKANHYYYMLSVYHLDETDNITVVNVPNIKKSWFHRLAFDCFGVKKYLKKFKIDEILSLQNTNVPCFKGKQTVYEHNALPFSEYKFSFKENKKMWIYQNIIGKMMIRSIRKSEQVIVQTKWMKNSIVEMVPEAKDKITVSFPEVSIPDGYKYLDQKPTVFFFPANSDNITDWKVIFTLTGNETEEIRRIYDTAKNNNLNFEWIGSIPREKVFKIYSHSVLVFPSYIETIGLPIYEAISVGCPVLLADCHYARDVAGDSRNAQFFDYCNPDSLYELLLNTIKYKRKKFNEDNNILFTSIP